ncbi:MULTISPECIES: YXWGXW repeat-containing protein [unclassified Acidovorax]|uniref:YXWGXW repeat-containing protein n=1 Tax=unclassified Acidovorax TaxID=2684926 RepID=UPI0006FF4254|nr:MULTISPECIES: YXWGXW repeat-containing protein [unclassified Acidovorax]KRB26608.1 hypothetical protein ASD94_14015 [Acidovorax sp. Root70]PUA97669.1 YXWGXW repeat-containing protein [Acidovorax sp. 107]
MTTTSLFSQTLTASALALAALLGTTAPAQAQVATQTTVIVQPGVVIPAPPPPRREAVPHARRGQVWVPGYWDWRGHRHVWVQGHFEKVRPGYRYRAPQWDQRDGRWELHRGGWDRDGDGIVNRNDRDRDGDGVPNRRDHQPDNPRRN